MPKKLFLFIMLFFPLFSGSAQDDFMVITADNASSIIKLGELTKGQANYAIWSPDGSKLMLSTSRGLHVYDANDWSAPPAVLEDRFLQGGFMSDGRVYGCCMLPPRSGVLEGGAFIAEFTANGNLQITDSIAEAPPRDGNSFNKFNHEYEPDGNWVRFGGSLWRPGTNRWESYGEQMCYSFYLAAFAQNLRACEDYVELPNVDNATAPVIRLFSSDGTLRGSLPLEWTTEAMKITASQDGKLLVLSGDPIVVWDLEAGQVKYHLPPSDTIDLTADGTILTVAYENTIILFDLATGGKLAVLENFDFPVQDITLSPDKTRLSVIDTKGEVMIFELISGQMIAKSTDYISVIHDADFVTEDTLILKQAEHLAYWNLVEGRVNHLQPIETFTLDNILVSFAEKAESTLTFIDSQTGTHLKQLEIEVQTSGYGFPVLLPVFSPDFTWMAVRVLDNGQPSLWIFDLLGGLENATLFSILPIDTPNGYQDYVINKTIPVAFSPDGTHLATYGWRNIDGNDFWGLTLWDIESSTPRYHYPITEQIEVIPDNDPTYGVSYYPAQYASDLQFSPDGQHVILLLEKGFYEDIPAEMIIIDVASGEIHHRIRLSETHNHIKFSPDNTLLFIQRGHFWDSFFDTSIYDTTTWQQVANLASDSGEMRLSSEGRLLLYFDQYTSRIELWGVPNNGAIADPLRTGLLTEIPEQTITYTLLQEQALSADVIIPDIPTKMYSPTCLNATLQFPQLAYTVEALDLKANYTPDSPTVLSLAAEQPFVVSGGPVCQPDGVYWRVVYNTEAIDLAEAWLRETNESQQVVVTSNIIPAECANYLTPRLVIGGQGMIPVDDAPNALNSLPKRPSQHADSIRLDSISGGEIFTIIWGPVCGDGGIVWWQVDYNGLIGWTGESQGNTYWIEPIQ